jgi:DMSO/TMAO reductase YedYZ molybdopterin-dependent catalytic subunit
MRVFRRDRFELRKAGAALRHGPESGPAHLEFRGARRGWKSLHAGGVELEALPRRETVCDIHCVTRWSRYDNRFGGAVPLPVQLLLARAQPVPTAKYALVHAEHGFTTNLPLDDLDRRPTCSRLTYNGEPLTAEHGGPVRLLVPHLYLWKSAKWVRGFELLEDDYTRDSGAEWLPHAGRSWQEQRYGRPDYSRMRRGPRA